MTFALELSPSAGTRAIGWADFSEDGRFRYLLGREWDPSLPRLLVCGLNPSKAGADEPDLTVTKLIGFSRRMAAGSFELVNAIPYIETFPGAMLELLREGGDMVGPLGDAWISAAAGRVPAPHAVVRRTHKPPTRCLVCWGGDGDDPVLKPRIKSVLGLLEGLPLVCLGKTKSGAPRHPSRLAYATAIEPFPGGAS